MVSLLPYAFEWSSHKGPFWFRLLYSLAVNLEVKDEEEIQGSLENVPGSFGHSMMNGDVGKQVHFIPAQVTYNSPSDPA